MTLQTDSEPPQPVAEAESLVGVAMHDLLAFFVEAETEAGIGHMTCFALDETEAREIAVRCGSIRTMRVARRTSHDMFRATHKRGVAYHDGAFS